MEIAIISGKGGTGKSSVSAAFATLGREVVLADCDVDAANLHLLFRPVHEEEQAYAGGMKAVIDESRCTNCGRCIDYCRFDAIAYAGERVRIDEISCDGCRLCMRICPFEAIGMSVRDDSRMYSGPFRSGQMVYGRLAPGEENSGKLVNLVRERARQLATRYGIATILIDGPPGIGCPVISSIAGVSHVVLVTEPSLSAFLDLKRVLKVTAGSDVQTWVIINKADLNPVVSDQIGEYCAASGIPVAARLPFDEGVINAMVNCASILEWAPGSVLAGALRSAWERITRETPPT